MASPLVFPPPVNPSDLGRGPWLLALEWLFTSTALIVVALRIYLRKKVVRIGLGWDDWLMVASMVCQLTSQCFLTVAFHYGMGKHDVDIERPGRYVSVLQWIWLSLLPGLIVSILARISIAILLLRLFGVHKWLKWYLIIFTAIQTVAGILLTIFVYSQNQPFSALWDVFDQNARHWNPKIEEDMEYIAQSFWTVCDLTYTLFPVMIIWKLNMSLNRRMSLILIMCGSLFTMAMSIVKLNKVQGPSVLTDHVLYDTALNILWPNLEQNCVIIMGCIPALRPVTQLKFPSGGRITSSISSFVRKMKSSQWDKTKGSSAAESSRGYQDLELNTNKLGYSGRDKSQTFVVTADYLPESRTSNSSVLETHVRRTDDFIVQYETTGTALYNN